MNKLDRTLPEDQRRWTTTRYTYDPQLGTLFGVAESLPALRDREDGPPALSIAVTTGRGS